MALHVSVGRDDLYRELQRIQSVVEVKNTIPILSNFLLVAKGSAIHLTATNLDMTWRTSIPAKVEGPGEITLEARKTHDIVRELGNDVTMEIQEEKEGWVVIRADYATFRIGSLPTQDFPTLPAYSEEDFNEVEAAVLWEMIEKTYFAVSASPDEQRRSLSGALLVQEDRSLKMVATDGHRLAFIIRESEKPAARPVNTIVPRRSLGEVRKLLEDAGDGTIHLKQQGNHIVFKRGDVTFLARVIDDKFPEYDLVIPKQFERTISLEREAFGRALRHVSVLAHERTKPVIVSLSKGRMVVKSNTPEMGEATEQVNIEYSQDDMDIGFNARYLLEVLGVIEEEKVYMNLNEPLSSGLIRPQKDENYLCIVMPMRI